ncbi:MAG: EamA family transporter [Brumimicrobium sp.]
MEEQRNIIKGVFFVGFGAAMYGMLATFVKIAYNEGYTTAEVTTAQFSIGLIILFLINQIRKLFGNNPVSVKKGDTKKLVIAGTSYGCTSLFYYLSVQYIDVSIAIILLMQSVWLSVVVEAFIDKKPPELKKIIATIIVLLGTFFATNVLQSDVQLDIRGLFWGMMAASSYTATMFTANKIANYLPPTQKSFIMLIGGAIVIFLFLIFSQIGPYYFDSFKSIYLTFSEDTSGIRAFNWNIFVGFGLFLAVFGTVLPPIFLNKGFPHAGLGLGSIVSSIELPVSVMMALILLGEKIAPIQWFGIVLILAAIILMNLNKELKFLLKKG